MRPLLFMTAALALACSDPADSADAEADGTDGTALDGTDGVSDGADGASDGTDGASDGTDGASDGADGTGGAYNGTPPSSPVSAPEFAATNRDGGARDREDLLGHPTVMWFYPAAGTYG